MVSYDGLAFMFLLYDRVVLLSLSKLAGENR